MSDLRTGGELVVDVLRAAGVDTAFGVLSIHNIPIVDAIARDGRIHFVAARGEAGATNMADGYARATGRVGVVVTSTGVGAANAAGALLEAHDGASPVLHITGQVDSAHLDTGRTLLHSNPRQLDLLKTLGKGAFRAARTEEIPAVIAKAVAMALDGRPGPVSVEIPIDQQFREVEFSSALVEPPREQVASERVLARCVEILQSAERPLIWAGGGASRLLPGDDSSALISLAARLGAGVVTTNAGRGAVPEDHPLCIGNFSVDESVVGLFQDSDAVLALGTSFRGNETRNWTLTMPEELVHVDRDHRRIGGSYPVALPVVADIGSTVAALLKLIDRRSGESAWTVRVGEVRRAARERWRAMLGAHEAILDGLQSSLPPNAVVVRDVTVPASAWASRLLEVHEPRTAIHSAALAIGQALSMAIGAAWGRPDRHTVVLVGDGGLSMALGELGTAVQEGLNLIVIVFNDRGYGILRNLQDAHFDGRRFGSDLYMPDFVTMASAFGCHAVRATSGSEVGPLVERALMSQGVTVLEVDLTAIGPMATPFTGAGRLVPERSGRR